ncbi:MAG: glycoside hydrolase domain-containing protein [Clostridium sp.]|uniref:glycoside hydrolase domain-containing protein n=1 Tax=Clostridium sp. TaxID=1506 RepID=UPI003EE58526
MDQMVLETQKWLNKTYKGRISALTEDGITGWSTIRALTKALQLELGAGADGLWGPGTESKCPTISSNSGNKNIITILQCGLYCKGYEGGGIDGNYTAKTSSGISSLKRDAGLSDTSGSATPLIFKALLSTMDGFVLASAGDDNVRKIQQNLNRDYYKVIGLIACNGVYSRDTNRALIKALQVEEGSSPDGIWGPGTQNKCPTIPGSRSNKKFVLLLQYSLYVNGVNPHGFDGLFGQGLSNAIKQFQTLCALPADGYAGKQVWASLLVSTGDKKRKGTACDCSQTITSQIAKTLKENGYKIVGRYLTGKFKMNPSEIQTIFNNGLRLFPIFEVGGYKNSYFTSSQGVTDARSAINAAMNLGFGKETIIYFAVDYDAYGSNIENNIIPYFSAIKNQFNENNPLNYRIGIYAPRHICTIVAQKGYSCSSFVCDMSSGFSGNLGYPLPKDWAFDQISTITIGSGEGLIEIDNNICSNLNQYTGVSSVNKNLQNIVEMLNELSACGQGIIKITNPKVEFLNYLRHYIYIGFQWNLTLGPINEEFINYVYKTYPDLVENLMPYIRDKNTKLAYISNQPVDLPHLAATTQGYMSSPAIPDFWTGWGGDLATAMANITAQKDKGGTIQEIADNIIGNEKFSCSRIDILADIDAIYFAEKLKLSGDVLQEYYSNVTSNIRKNIFLKSVGFNSTPSLNELNNRIYDMMTGLKGFKYLIKGGVLLKKKATYKDKTTGKEIEPTEEIQKAAVLAFSKYIFNKL